MSRMFHRILANQKCRQNHEIQTFRMSRVTHQTQRSQRSTSAPFLQDTHRPSK
jgi:hypothetical protein